MTNSTIKPLLTLRVLAKLHEAEDICRIVLDDPNGRPVPPFKAGAHVDVHLPSGLIRQYSLCNSPHESDRYILAVLREPQSRGGSVEIHDRIREGDLLPMSAPRNRFPLLEGTHHSVLLAGGIGITPILAMAEELFAKGESFELHYCCRTPARMAFRQQLITAPYAFRVHPHFDNGPTEQRFDIIKTLASSPQGCHLYVCGPSGFINHVLNAAAIAGWDTDRLHFERFTGSASAAPQGNTAFDVWIASSGAVIHVAADATVVAALNAAGVVVPISCEQGVCGTCLTRVIEGDVDHRDHYLTELEKALNDRILPCCSRAKSSHLVLDL